ncbi:MAG: DUF2155 domain-containing protein [Xanthobacteraceae bacterium]|nr:DUF2155 domain-containing protein [Xanthobacteraceae bacterium]
MIRNSHRLIAAGVISATLAAGSALGQLLPPANVQQAPLPPPQQQQQQQAPQQKQQPAPQLPPELMQPAEKKKAAKTKQKTKDGKELPPPNTTPETLTQSPEGERIANPTASFSGLDKISGRIIMFEVALNETVQFGALQVTPRACYTRPATETQNTTSFVEVDEITLKAEIRRIFTGWMFASSPGLNAVEHPIYDVWLIDCKTTPPSITPSEGQQ